MAKFIPTTGAVKSNSISREEKICEYLRQKTSNCKCLDGNGFKILSSGPLVT
jgi:hypothetical protein